MLNACFELPSNPFGSHDASHTQATAAAANSVYAKSCVQEDMDAIRKNYYNTYILAILTARQSCLVSVIELKLSVYYYFAKRTPDFCTDLDLCISRQAALE
jgi:hypothetical protein